MGNGVFNVRGPNDFLMRLGNGTVQNTTIVDGDEVVLTTLDQTVHVQNVAVLAPGQFAGVITGFQPSHAETVNGLSIGDRVEFDMSHIHGVIRD